MSQLKRALRESLREAGVDYDRPVAVISLLNSKTLGVLEPTPDNNRDNQISNKLRGYKLMFRFQPKGTPVTLTGNIDDIVAQIKEQYRKIGQSF